MGRNNADFEAGHSFEDVGDALLEWSGLSDYVSHGGTSWEAKKTLRDELATNSKPISVKLYRGASMHPAEEIGRRRHNKWLGFTPNLDIAKGFAGPNGKVYSIDAGKARGIRKNDYNIFPAEWNGHIVDHRHEDEYLVHPDSVIHAKEHTE